MNSIIVRVAQLVLILFVVACSQKNPESNPGERLRQQRDLHCRFVGNSQAKTYCLTTFTEILANPDLFEGQLIMVRGWAREEQKVLALFPSKDAAEAAELQSSILVRSGAAIDDISMALKAGNSPRALTLGGRLVLRASREGGTTLRYRFGGLDEVDEMRP
jgi:hypothetical protein